MFHCLFDTSYESKEKFRTVALSSSNFPMKLVCWGYFVFACLEKSILIIFGGTDSLVRFLLHNNCFFIFRRVFMRFLFVFLRVDQKMVYCQLIH